MIDEHSSHDVFPEAPAPGAPDVAAIRAYWARIERPDAPPHAWVARSDALALLAALDAATRELTPLRDEVKRLRVETAYIEEVIEDLKKQRDAARALVRRLIDGILRGGIDQEYFAALKDARAAVEGWGDD